VSAPHLMIVLNRLGTGGVERVALHLANGLAARGNRVTLVLLSSGGVLEHLITPEVDGARFGHSLERGARLLRVAPKLARLIRDRRPDVLLSPGNHMHAVVTLAHRLAGRSGKLALKMTNPVERARAGRLVNAARRRFFRIVARRAASILALSDAAQREAAAIAPAAAAKIRVVANPYVDDALLIRERKPRKASAGDPILLSVGRLTPQKDPLMMIEALAGLKDRSWRLVMLGEGPLAAEVQARAAALGIADRLELPGYVADPRPYFEKARLFLLSSRYEELPAVLFEAMAAGVPIVSTAASASVVQALDSGRLGKLVPPGDAGAFRAAIAEALDSPAAAPDARSWIERFTIQAGVASHAEALGLR
jgi:glycosyltransferase involved in cell wall biosynthesis